MSTKCVRSGGGLNSLIGFWNSQGAEEQSPRKDVGSLSKSCDNSFKFSYQRKVEKNPGKLWEDKKHGGENHRFSGRIEYSSLNNIQSKLRGGESKPIGKICDRVTICDKICDNSEISDKKQEARGNLKSQYQKDQFKISPLLESKNVGDKACDVVNQGKVVKAVECSDDPGHIPSTEGGRATDGNSSHKYQSSTTTTSSPPHTQKTVSPFHKFRQLETTSLPRAPAVQLYRNWSLPPSPRPAIATPSPRSGSGAKELILTWVQEKLKDYPIPMTNFSTCWNDGLAFCALIHVFYPDNFDWHDLDTKNRRHNFTLAFDKAEQLADICPLLEVEDMVRFQKPDWKCVFTYVQSFYRRFRDRRIPANKFSSSISVVGKHSQAEMENEGKRKRSGQTQMEEEKKSFSHQLNTGAEE